MQTELLDQPREAVFLVVIIYLTLTALSSISLLPHKHMHKTALLPTDNVRSHPEVCRGSLESSFVRLLVWYCGNATLACKVVPGGVAAGALKVHSVSWLVWCCGNVSLHAS